MRHVSPLGAGSKSSVAQADEVIIALPGEKSKMSIYDKNPSEEGLILEGGFVFCGGYQLNPFRSQDKISTATTATAINKPLTNQISHHSIL